MEEIEGKDNERFHLFISYTTDPDFSFARRLESFLETFHRLSSPAGLSLKQLRVCRDGSDFHTSGASGTESVLDEYLSRCDELLVLCSKRARSSPWVNQEIQWFLDRGRVDSIRVAITEGEHLGQLTDDILPPALVGAGLQKTIAYDFRGARGRASEQWESVRQLDDEMVRLAADLNERSPAEIQPIWFREQRNQARRNLWIAAAIAAALFVLATVAWIQRNRAVELAESTRRQLYVANVQLADRAWNEGNVAVARRALAVLRPGRSQLELRDFDWFHLWRKIDTEVGRLHVPGVALTTAAISPDGRLVAVGGRRWAEEEGPTRTVYLFSREDGKLIRTLEGHSAAIASVAFHPTQGWLLTASENEIRMWAAADFTPIATSFRGGANHLSFSANGSRLAVTTALDVAIFSVLDRGLQELVTYQVSDSDIGRPGLSPDGSQLVAANNKSEVVLYDISGRTSRVIHRGKDVTITDACWTADSSYAVTAGTGAYGVQFHPMRSGLAPFQLQQSGPVQSLALSPDNKTLAVGFGDPVDLDSGRVVALWDLHSRTQYATLRGPARRIATLTFTTDGQWLVGATEEEDAHVWSVEAGRYRRVQPGKDVWSFDVTPDGQIVALAEAEGDVSLVDMQSGAVTRRHGVHGWRSESIALRPTTGEVVSSGRDLNLRLWEPNLARSTVLGTATHLFTSLVFSPDGATLATANCDQKLRLWNAGNWASVPEVWESGRCLAFATWSPDSQVVATGGGDPANAKSPTAISLYRPSSKSATSLEGASSWPRSAAYSADGRLLATGHWNGEVLVWDLRSGKRLWTFLGHQGLVTDVSFSPAGLSLASGGVDGTVRLWDVKTGQPRTVLTDGPKSINALRFLPDGSALMAAGTDLPVVVWYASKRD